MAKIIRSGNTVTIIYTDGVTVIRKDVNDENLFVTAFLYQDDEEELQKYFPKPIFKEKELINKLEEIKKLLDRKKGGLNG